MSDHGTHEAISLPDADSNGIELAADRPREARPACEDELSRIGPAQLEEVEGGVRTHDRWERVVDVVARGRQ
jgi:catechol-2,3-dioxygenase